MKIKIIQNSMSIMTLVDGNTEINFDRSAGSTRKEAISHIVTGLNHMLAWAQDKDCSIEDQKYKENFLNELMILFNNIKRTSQDMNRQLINIAVAKITNEKHEAEKIIFKEEIMKIKNVIYEGIVKYVSENSVHNTKTDDTHLSLTEDTITIYTNISTAIKLVYVYYIALCSNTFKSYNDDVTPYIISKIQEATLDYHFKRNDMLKYNELYTTDFNALIYQKTYDYVVKERPKETLINKFSISGYSENRITNEIIDEMLLTINKIAPVLIEDRVNSIKFDCDKEGVNYKDYKFIDLSTVKYMQTTLRQMVINKFRIIMKNMVSIYKPSSNDDIDQYKQELTMMKKNEAQTYNKKKLIECIRNYMKIYLTAHDEFSNRQIFSNKNGLLNNILVLNFLDEVGGDSEALKLLDDELYFNILRYITHRLIDKYRILTLAIYCESNDTYTDKSKVPVFKPENLNKIKSTTNYCVDPERNEQVIFQIVSKEYKNKENNYIISIEDEFIEFLAQRDLGNVLFMNDYIYDYAVKDEDVEDVDDDEEEFI